MKSTVTLFDPRKYAPFPSGSTPVYRATFLDEDGNLIDEASFSALTLSVVDVDTNAVITNAEDMLTSARASFDGSGLLSIALSDDETQVSGKPRSSRALVLSWTYGPNDYVGRHQANFNVIQLAGDT